MSAANSDTEKKKGGRALLVTTIVLCVTLAAACALCAAVCYAAESDETIRKNVRVMDLELGGMTEREAKDHLLAQLPTLLAENGLRVTRNGEEVAFFPLASLGAEMDAPRIAATAYSAGRTGGSALNALRYVETLVGLRTYRINVHWTCDEQALAEAAASVAADIDCEAVDFSWEVGEDCVLITRAADGAAVRQEELLYLLRKALQSVDLEAVECPVDTLAAQRGTAQQVHDAVCGALVEPSFDKENQQVIGGRAGVSFDAAAAQSALDAAADGETIRVAAVVEQPQHTAEEYEALLFRDELSSYSTWVSGASGRKENVRISAAYCNGHILNPGESLDYLALVGPCTAANGYKLAPVYINGKTVDDIGGGVCQTASTLYAAALHANLAILQRVNHGFASSYIPLGLDATVSNGGPVFEFQNDTAYPIRIDTLYENNKLTVVIRGTKLDDTYVKMVTEVLSSTPYEVETVETTDLAPGETREEQSPYTGYDTRTYRNVYAGDGTLISQTFESRSIYRKRNQILLVGVDPAAQEEAAADAPAVAPPPEDVAFSRISTRVAAASPTLMV